MREEERGLLSISSCLQLRWGNKPATSPRRHNNSFLRPSAASLLTLSWYLGFNRVEDVAVFVYQFKSLWNSALLYFVLLYSTLFYSTLLKLIDGSGGRGQLDLKGSCCLPCGHAPWCSEPTRPLVFGLTSQTWREHVASEIKISFTVRTGFSCSVRNISQSQ